MLSQISKRIKTMVSKIFKWMFNAGSDQSTPKEWFAGLVLILILSFLWSTVIKSMDEI